MKGIRKIEMIKKDKMTKEEAIREIDDIDYYLQHHTDDYSESSHTAMMMAISALEQEPCENAISREAVREFVERIQAIKDSHNENGTPINYGTICDLVIQGWKLMKLPSVQPSRKGHWINECFDKSEKQFFLCDKCSCGGLKFNSFNFCPNCGADMRGNTDADSN